MNILILYDSVEGHTRDIAEHLSVLLEGQGHEIFVTRAGDPGYCDPGTFDASILCAPIHIGRYPAAFVNYVKAWKEALSSKPSAFVSVTLAIASDKSDEREEAIGFPGELENETGWRPDMVHNAAGALKYLEYDFFKRWMMRRISAKEGGETDTSQNHILTDWQALDTFVGDFLKTVSD